MKIVAFAVSYDAEQVSIAPNLILEQEIKVKADFLKKGAVLKFLRMASGQPDDDFVYSRYTTIVKYKYFKAPRFLTAWLLKNGKRK